MNFGAAFNVLGALLMVEGAFLMPPLLYGIYRGEGSIQAFLIAIAVALVVGAVLFFMPRKHERIRGRGGVVDIVSLALLPRVGSNGFRIFKAETPGLVAGKVEPRMKDTAKALYKIYLFITVVLFVLLVTFGMNVFDAVVHTLGVVGTGGFSSHANSCAVYIDNSAILIIMSVFMVICGTNFSLYSRAVGGRWREMFLDEEYRLYLKIVAGAVLLIALNLILSKKMTPGLGLRIPFSSDQHYFHIGLRLFRLRSMAGLQ